MDSTNQQRGQKIIYDENKIFVEDKNCSFSSLCKTVRCSQAVLVHLFSLKNLGNRTTTYETVSPQFLSKTK